jgi:peptide/nickel transport system permease protein
MESLSKLETQTQNQAQTQGQFHAIRLLFKDKAFLISAVILVFIVFSSVFAPLITPHSPDKMDIRSRLAPPVFFGEEGSVNHIFGTDGLGRDIAARILFGLRTSLMIAFFSVLIIFGIGIFVGLLSGIYGKTTDSIIMTMTDIQLSLPLLVIAVILLAVASPTIFSITIVLGISGWPIYARATRSSVLRETKKDYILAAKILGASSFWILRKYFLKNVILSTLSFVVLEFGLMIVWEALLSFIGIGIQPPDISLGTIMGDGLNYLINAWWITTIPGLFITIITISLSFISRGIVKTLSV